MGRVWGGHRASPSIARRSQDPRRPGYLSGGDCPGTGRNPRGVKCLGGTPDATAVTRRKTSVQGAQSAAATAEPRRPAGVEICWATLAGSGRRRHTQHSFEIVYSTCLWRFFWRCLRQAFRGEGKVRACFCCCCCLVAGGFTLDRK